jgi:hypothetical protein
MQPILLHPDFMIKRAISEFSFENYYQGGKIYGKGNKQDIASILDDYAG